MKPELIFLPCLRYAFRTICYAGKDAIGHIDDCGDRRPAYRFKPETRLGNFDTFPTMEEAKAFLQARAAEVIVFIASSRAAEAEFNALPGHLRELVEAEQAAHFEMHRAWGRDPFDSNAYQTASKVWHDALAAMNAAIEAHRNVRRAA